MKVGRKTVVRGSAQTWADMVAGASHWCAVLRDTETGRQIDGPTDFADPVAALAWCADRYLAEYDWTSHILVLGASISDMCLDWD